MYEVRFYRDWVKRSGLVGFSVVCRESDLMVRAHRNLHRKAEELLRGFRADIEQQIRLEPEFRESLSALPMPAAAKPIVRAMIEASSAYGVGPMAAVAGAVAQFVGEGLLRWSPEVIVENGGDIYVKMDHPVEIGLYAGAQSPFSGEVRLRVDPAGKGVGVCTSSGTVGHSMSLGKADAVVAVADDAALADAAATAVGNRVGSVDDVANVLDEEQARGLLKGLFVAVAKRMGAYGQIELVH